MKRICLEWSRGRHFSPSLPGDKYLVLGFKTDLRAELSGNIVWYKALALRPEVLRSFSSFYGNLVVWGYKWNRQKPRLSWSRLFLWNHFKFISEKKWLLKRLLLVKWHYFQKCEKWQFFNNLQSPYMVRQNCQKWPILWIKSRSTRSETRQNSFLSWPSLFLYGV